MPAATPSKRHFCAFAKDQAHHVPALRAERHPHAEFTGALACHIRNHAINSDAGKKQRERREYAEKNHRQPPRGERAGHDCLHRLYAVDHLARVDLLHAAANLVHMPAGSPAVRSTTATASAASGMSFSGSCMKG